MKRQFPNRIAVTIDEQASGDIADNLLAWKSTRTADPGRVAIYELVDEFDKKIVTKLRRKGTKTWFE